MPFQSTIGTGIQSQNLSYRKLNPSHWATAKFHATGHNIVLQDSASGSEEYLNGGLSLTNMERELKASIAKLYQNYDCVTDEYDRLFDIVDVIREDYTNTKSMFVYYR